MLYVIHMFKSSITCGIMQLRIHVAGCGYRWRPSTFLLSSFVLGRWSKQFLEAWHLFRKKSLISSFNTVFNEKEHSPNLIEVAISFNKNSKNRFKISKWVNICSTFIACKTQCLCIESFICIMLCSINYLSYKLLVWH